MGRHKDGILIALCVAAGLAWIAFHGDHPGLGPLGWANTGRRSVGVGFLAHLIELETRRVAAAVAAVITIR